MRLYLYILYMYISICFLSMSKCRFPTESKNFVAIIIFLKIEEFPIKFIKIVF